ncbi:MAG: DUF4743 domain-containing protein [Proteobacteria bacterium]|nr:DUF4743 domain-containing protein [Pseudomonadota bacterium]
MPYSDHIRACNNHVEERFVPFLVDGNRLGKIRRTAVGLLARHPNVFDIRDDSVSLAGRLQGFDERSEAVSTVVAALKSEGAVPPGEPEAYPVTRAFGETAHFQIDRSAVPFFGVPAFGVHVNGFCRDPSGEIQMWIGRRGDHIRVEPGKLDNMVAGGQPIGLSLMENLIKEADEEAGIPEQLARHAEAVGHVSYQMEIDGGFRPDTMFCYDLELPSDFEPQCQDGSVSEFYLWPIERVAQIVETSFDFKFNCPLPIIDFLIRHGFIGEDHPEYSLLVDGLHG